MAWRNRTVAENGSLVGTSDTSWQNVLPSGVGWLTSDVVDIENVPSAATFAMEMSYDNDINTFLGQPPVPATVANFSLGKLVNGKWVNAASAATGTTPGADAYMNGSVGYPGSLTQFLQAYLYGGGRGTFTLAQLAGSWGVDTVFDELVGDCQQRQRPVRRCWRRHNLPLGVGRQRKLERPEQMDGW